MMSPSELGSLGIAFGFGVLSSLHCGVMCGPLAASTLHLSKTPIFSTISYQSMRLVSYSLLGLLVFFFGQGVMSLPVFPDWLAYFPAFLLFLVFLGLVLPGLSLGKLGKVVKPPVFFQRLLTKLYAHGKPWQVAGGIGLFTGFLPCGVLYPAYAFAAAASEVSLAWERMFVFYLGTLPVFVMVSGGWTWFRRRLSPEVFRFAAIVMVILGLGITTYRIHGELQARCEHPSSL